MMEKQAIRDAVRLRVSQTLSALLDAQVANAQGLKYLVSRDTAGKFNRIGPAGITGNEDEVIEVWEKDPSIQAFTDLLNRASDKPQEQPIIIQLATLDARKARLNAAKRRIETP